MLFGFFRVFGVCLFGNVGKQLYMEQGAEHGYGLMS